MNEGESVVVFRGREDYEQVFELRFRAIERGGVGGFEEGEVVGAMEFVEFALEASGRVARVEWSATDGVALSVATGAGRCCQETGYEGKEVGKEAKGGGEELIQQAERHK